MDDYVPLLFRWLHILAAITAVGGTIFSRFALLPAATTLPEEQHHSLMEAVRKNWAKFVHMSVAFLLISGLYNYLLVIKAKYVVEKPYDMVWGIKFLLAIVVFGIASMLVGRSAAGQKFRQNARMWLNVNVVLTLIIVGMSGYLRAIPRTLKQAVPAPVVAPAQPTEPAK